MKNFTLAVLLLISTFTYAQPKLVGAVSYGGPNNGGSLFRTDLPGTSPGIIYSFNNKSPHAPTGGVCAGDADWLYGMLNYNGTNSDGCFYRIKKDGTSFTALSNLSFSGGRNTIPYYHTDGSIYYSNEFEIKKFNPVGNSTTTLPLNLGILSRNLLIDATDWVYFATAFGISKIKTDGSGWTDLHTFNAPTEGSYGRAGLTETSGDTLFGVQSFEGLNNEGTLYSIKKDGTGFIVHHQFSSATGSFPESKLIYFDGKLYGTTSRGGDFDMGVLYSINPDGTNYHILHHFETGLYSSANPAGNISISSNGRIFGAFSQFYATAGNFYRLFKVDTSGENYQPLFTLTQREIGSFIQDPLLTDNDENIFMTSRELGRFDGGVVSRCDTSGFGNELHHFGYSANGFFPRNGLIKSTNGKLYGTTFIGGTDGSGSIFSVNPDGTGYLIVHNFSDAEGYEITGKLLEASDGKLYGACQQGNVSNAGSIYRVDKNGSNFETIYSVQNLANGYRPQGSLVEDAGGTLYGTMSSSISGSGVVFRIDKNGNNYTVLHSFLVSSGLTMPLCGLTLSANYLYGTTYGGGIGGIGGVYRVRTDGTGYEILHEFNGPTDGANPRSAPLIASNGKLYGTTSFGGGNGEGAIYTMDIAGTGYTILRNLSNTTDGSYPSAGLIQASDGLLYGSTFSSNIAPGGGGSIYKMNLNGTGFTVVKEFLGQTEGGGLVDLLDLNGNFISLPVQLISFNAQKKDRTALLTWKTAQEEKSDRFEVERLTGRNNFTTIGQVASAGTTNSITVYSFTDNNPFNGINYYRLKQIDIDGKSTYSKTVPVNFTASGKVILSPNPATDHLDIWVPQSAKFSSIRIVDISGKSVLQKAILSSTGNMQIDISHLSKGWYVLQLGGEVQEQVVFAKQ